MISLANISTPYEFERLINAIPNSSLTTKLIGSGKIITLLDVKSIKLIKKETLKYIVSWKSDLTMHENALKLIEELKENCAIEKERNRAYIQSMERNLTSIESNLSKKNNPMPTERQKIAIANLKRGIANYYQERKLGFAIATSLSDLDTAENDVDTFISYKFGEQYSADFYYDYDYNDRHINNAIKSSPISDAFEGDFSQDPNF